MNFNYALIGGRLGRKPEIRFTQQQHPYCGISLAVDRWVKGKDGAEGRTETDWFYVTVWGKTAENVCEYCEKGQQVVVEAVLTNRKEQTKDGEKTHIGLTARRVQWVLPPSRNRQAGDARRENPPQSRSSGQGRGGNPPAASNPGEGDWGDDPSAVDCPWN